MDTYPWTHELYNLELIRMWKICQSGKWSYFSCIGSSCENVGFNQQLPLQCKLCMNILHVCFGKSEINFDVHVKTAFVLTSNVHLTFGHSLIF